MAENQWVVYCSYFTLPKGGVPFHSIFNELARDYCRVSNGFKYFLCSLRKLGKMNPFLTFAYFSKGLVKNHQLENKPTRLCKRFFQHIFERILIHKPATTPPSFYGSDLSSFLGSKHWEPSDGFVEKNRRAEFVTRALAVIRVLVCCRKLVNGL